MAIQDFSFFSHSHENIEHRVYWAGDGPAVLLIHELPGMIPECVAFAERLIQAGYTVYLPLLFGKAEQSPKFLSPFVQLCIQKEFYLFSKNKTSPILHWLRSLCRKAQADRPDWGVGAIGMCLTGGFAIPLMVEPSMMAPVLSQPSLPLGLSSSSHRAFGCSAQDLQIAKDRVDQGQEIQAFRFDADILVPAARMQAYQEYFGENFHYHELDSSQQKAYKKGCHSVFTGDFVDEPEHPTRQALDILLDFLERKLKKK